MNGEPVWSPDGQTIAFGSNEGGSAKVWQVPAAGGVPRSFANTSLSADTLSLLLAWAPGRDILYHRPGNRNFYLLEQDGTESPFLTNDHLGWIFHPSYSPDGKEVAASWNLGRGPRGLGIFVFPLDGSTPREQRARRVSERLSIGSIGQSVDAAPFRGRDVKLVAHVRTQVIGDNAGQCWLRVDQPKAQQGFFDNMANRTIRTPAWSAHEIVGKVDGDADRIAFGCFLRGPGRLWVDDVQLSFKNDAGEWAPIAIKNAGFEDVDGQQRPAGWIAPALGYTFRLTSENPYRGKTSVEISAVQVPAGRFFAVGWSPDGKLIYAYEDDDPRHIVAIPAEGGPATPFLTLPVPEGRSIMESRMAPDGRHIAFTVGESKSDVRIITNFDPSVR